jgi:hypothetical protein
MMGYSPGDRVVLRRAHAGIPAGSLGTVVSGTAATSVVNFDVDPSCSVLVPNTSLVPASARASAARQYAWSATESGTKTVGAEVLWYTPHVVTPGVGTAANFVAVTVTPNLLSLLLQNAEVALRGSSTSGCWIGSLEFPVSGGPANLSVDIRGFVKQPEGARTSIFVVIGAVSKSIAFDDARSDDFTKTFEATIGGEPVQTITIILLAERPAGSDDLLLVADSIDIIAVAPSAIAASQS